MKNTKKQSKQVLRSQGPVLPSGEKHIGEYLTLSRHHIDKAKEFLIGPYPDFAANQLFLYFAEDEPDFLYFKFAEHSHQPYTAACVAYAQEELMLYEIHG